MSHSGTAPTRGLASLLARLAGSGLVQLRGKALRWAGARATSLELLSGTRAALDISEAALAGEPVRELAVRIEMHARSLSGAAKAVVLGHTAGTLSALSQEDLPPALLMLAQEACVSLSPRRSGPGEPRAFAVPLPAGGGCAGVLVLLPGPGKRLRHARLGPLLQRGGIALASAERQSRKDHFLSLAAHELKTPLTTIKGYAYSLARRIERGETVEPYTALVLERQAERLHGLLEEMLEVSRLETGRFVLHREPCDLRELLEASLRALRRLGKDGLSIEDGDGPLPLYADRDRLERALVALFAEARGHGSAVSARTARRSGRAVLEVVWEGEPLAETAQRSAFAPRWEWPAGQRLGLGMSLSIAERVAALHGGALRCERACYVMELPLLERRTRPRGPSPSRAVLVVDDDEAIAQMLASFLGESGMAAEFATGGRAALERMRAAPPDLLVLDLRMPEMDGRALLREVRALGLRPRVILLSADREAARAALELEVDAFVEKPFSPEGLLAAVERALGQPATLHEP